MKKIFTFFAAFMFCSIQTILATDVSGTISTNGTWNSAGSPYIVTSSITIQSGITLTIESGVTVKFNDNQFLYVYGTLNADNVVFTTSSGSPAPGKWGYIQVGNGTYAGIANISNSQIQYAQKLHVENGTATLSNTNISNCSIDGVMVTTAGELNMTGGNINGVTYSGVAVNTGGVAMLNGVGISNAASNGIWLNTGSTANITDCSVSLCNYPVYYSGPSSVTMNGVNSFTGNTKKFIYFDFSTLNTNMSIPTYPIPIHFSNWFTVNEGKTLEIGSNNILKFQDNTALGINGTLIAKASVGDSICFTSISDDNWGGDSNNDGTITSASSGRWRGVEFYDISNDANSVLRRCQIRYAGSGNLGGISMWNASPVIDSCDFSNNYFGVYIQYASNPVFTNNRIGSSQMTSIAMSFEANPSMSNNTFSFSDNAYDAIGLIGGTLTANATLKIRSVTSVQNITYLMLGQIIIPSGKTLTINKGIVIKSSPGNDHRIIVDGTLTANATADSMITFTSSRDDNFGNPGDSNKDGTITSPQVGDVHGIIFTPGSNGTLNYCRIKYATSWYNFTTCSTNENISETAVAMIDASPVISNCEFIDLKYGISCYRASNPVLSNNSMINIQYTPINISGSSNPTLSGITFTNVGWQAIGLLGGNVCQNGTIKKRDLAGFTGISYILLTNLNINSGTFVNVEPGVVIKMNNSGIYVEGGFKTDGTAGQQVVFTSIQDDNEGNPKDSNGDGNASTPAAGNWGCIKFASSSDDAYCTIKYATLKYAGSWNEGGISFENAGSTVKNTTISNTSNFGVFCNGSSAPLIDSVIIQNCSLDPIAMSLTSNPAFSNITFTSNFSQAIKIIEGTLSSNATLAPRNIAGINNIAYIINELTISSNAKLIIQPDVVIKFRRDVWWSSINITVHGNLIANGTASHKIYFTSFADDSKGGDSNNNGNASSPAMGDWGQRYYQPDGGILIQNNSLVADTVNSLKYCEISYASISLRIENSHATIDNCIIQLANNYGATIVGSANPDFKNTQFYNISISPIQLSMFSNPTFTDCSALNVGYMALSVIPEIYSQTDTIPVRNFGGYNNITYYLPNGSSTINSGTTITIPEGVVFKGLFGLAFIVNGRLNIQGTSGNPVVFTIDKDDNYGNPGDTNQDGTASLPPADYRTGDNWIIFNDVSDDLSTIKNAIFKYGDKGISTLSASPTIDSVRFEKLYYGVDMNGVSAPKIDNCIFHNLQYYPMQISLVSYPTSTSNNIISGTTYKVIKVKDETLTQDVTLTKRDFGGVTNIPYFFERYTIGTGATLNISPGIVCKFQVKPWWNDGGMGIDVFKGLSAIGGASADSNIVFTSIRDDFYGGDSNSDGTATKVNKDYYGYDGLWNGLIFENQALDPICNLKNCIIRFADKGIKTISASPAIENCNINNNNYGVYATAASNPIINNCDFNDNFNFAINNVDKSFVINAQNCWWGSNMGPVQTNSQGNGTSEQEIVTDAVNYTPWKTTGAGNPIMGDVSLNGNVQAYDASLVLQNVVGNITLSVSQQQVADVSGSGDITAYDASLILQYAVGLIQSFPAELKKSNFSESAYAQLIVGNALVLNGQEANIPLSATNVSGMYSSEIKLQYDPVYLQVSKVTNMIPEMNLLYKDEGINGLLTIVMAGTHPLNSDAQLVQVTFHALLPSGKSATTSLNVNKFLANENDLTGIVTNGNITITGNVTGIFTNSGNIKGVMSPVYPNPSFGNAMLEFQLNENNQRVIIEVFNLMGQKLTTIKNETMYVGKYSVPLLYQGNQLDKGSYLLRMTVDGQSQSQIFQIVR